MPRAVKIGYVIGAFAHQARERRIKAIEGRLDPSIDLHLIETDVAVDVRGWTPVDTAAAEAAFVAAFREAERDGCDAVVPDGMLDVGVEAGRSAVRIPVVAPFQAALHIAACVGARIGVIHYTRGYIPVLWDAVRRYQMSQNVVAIVPLDVEMVDLDEQLAAVRARVVAVSRAMIAEQAVDVVVPTGPGLCPVMLQPDWLSQSIDAPVVEGIGAPIQLAAAMVRLGLTQSPVRWPPAVNRAV